MRGAGALGLAGFLIVTGCASPSSDGDAPDVFEASDVEAEDTAPEVPPEPPPWGLDVMTFNVLCSFCNPDEYEPWEARLGHFDDIFARYEPDVIGSQEIALPDEVDQVLALLPGYAVVYFDEGTDLPNPDAAIFFDAARFEALDQGHYWLSPTPDEPWTTGFPGGQVLPRLVSWVRLADAEADGRELLVLNTHFDANSPAQDHSAELVIARTIEMVGESDLPVVLLGDFNSEPDSVAYTTLTAGDGYVFADAYALAEAPLAASNQDPPYAWDPAGRIDHIFAGGAAWTCDHWVVDLHVYGADSLFPSDHFPVFARLAVPSS